MERRVRCLHKQCGKEEEEGWDHRVLKNEWEFNSCLDVFGGLSGGEKSMAKGPVGLRPLWVECMSQGQLRLGGHQGAGFR